MKKKELHELINKRDELWDYISLCIRENGKKKSSILGELVEIERTLSKLTK